MSNRLVQRNANRARRAQEEEDREAAERREREKAEETKQKERWRRVIMAETLDQQRDQLDRPDPATVRPHAASTSTSTSTQPQASTSFGPPTSTATAPTATDKMVHVSGRLRSDRNQEKRALSEADADDRIDYGRNVVQKAGEGSAAGAASRKPDPYHQMEHYAELEISSRTGPR